MEWGGGEQLGVVKGGNCNQGILCEGKKTIFKKRGKKKSICDFFQNVFLGDTEFSSLEAVFINRCWS